MYKNMKKTKYVKTIKAKKEILMAAYVTVDMATSLRSIAEREELPISFVLRRAFKAEIARCEEQ